GPGLGAHARSARGRRDLPHAAQGCARAADDQDPWRLGPSHGERRGDRAAGRERGRGRYHRAPAHARAAVHRAGALGGARGRGVGNGDVRSVDDARAMVAATGCVAVMIGRGALGAPWIFRGAPTLEAERAAIIRRHCALIEAHLPERLALVQLKKHLAWYSAGRPGSDALRPRLFAASSASEVRALFWSGW